MRELLSALAFRPLHCRLAGVLFASGVKLPALMDDASEAESADEVLGRLFKRLHGRWSPAVAAMANFLCWMADAMTKDEIAEMSSLSNARYAAHRAEVRPLSSATSWMTSRDAASLSNMRRASSACSRLRATR